MNEQSPIENIRNEAKVGSSLIMAPHELAPWLEDGEVKEYVLMEKATEPRNKLNGVKVEIVEILGDKLRVLVDGKETQIPKIFFEQFPKR